MNTDPWMRRLGDVIQAVAVLAIVGLSVAVIDLRITVAKSQTLLSAQDHFFTTQLGGLKENLGLQLKVLDSIIKRITANGFDKAAGQRLKEDIVRVANDLRSHELETRRHLDGLTDAVINMKSEIKENTIGKVKGDD